MESTKTQPRRAPRACVNPPAFLLLALVQHVLSPSLFHKSPTRSVHPAITRGHFSLFSTLDSTRASLESTSPSLSLSFVRSILPIDRFDSRPLAEHKQTLRTPDVTHTRKRPRRDARVRCFLRNSGLAHVAVPAGGAPLCFSPPLADFRRSRVSGALKSNRS